MSATMSTIPSEAHQRAWWSNSQLTHPRPRTRPGDSGRVSPAHSQAHQQAQNSWPHKAKPPRCCWGIICARWPLLSPTGGGLWGRLSAGTQRTVWRGQLQGGQTFCPRRAGPPREQGILPSVRLSQGAEEELQAAPTFPFLPLPCFRDAWTFPNWFYLFQTGSRFACTRVYVCTRTNFIISEESTL